MSLVPLMLLYLWSKRGGGGALSMPAWPTPASPPPAPPPLPAFQAQPQPVRATAETATPLAELHTAPPTVATPATAAPKPRKSAAAATSTAGTSRVAVRDLQRLLIARGAKVVPDGLYGPKTAAAWSALAKKKGLPPTISRLDSKTARVASRAYDALSVPAIP